MLLNEEQQLLRDTLRTFARDELAPRAAQWDREHVFPRDALKALGGLGALGIVVPERWDGAGMDCQRTELRCVRPDRRIWQR